MRTFRFAAVVSAATSLLLAGCRSDPLPSAVSSVETTPPRMAMAAAAGQNGSWSAPFSWPTTAAHMTVLPDGRLLSWTSNDSDHMHSNTTVYRHSADLTTYEPVTNSFTDVFCAAHSFLPDGDLFIAGGHYDIGGGIKDANLFNYKSGQWSRLMSMRAGRWYPTTATMGNGEIVVAGGSDEHHHMNPYPEVWDGSKFRLLGGAPLTMPYYPWLHLGPDGRIFNAGPDKTTLYLNPSGDGEWTTPRASLSGVVRDYGTSVMYEPGKVLIIAGGDPPIGTAETIDLKAGTGWQQTGPLTHARRQFNAQILADGKVLVIGGTGARGFNTESGAILTPELWSPATGTWTTLADMTIPRMYHSVAVLLPDARVLTAGGGRCGECTVNRLDAQIFSPPYLFNADGSPAARPTITALSNTTVDRGQTLTITTPDAATVSRVTLVRLPSTTHGFNMNQGFITLTPTTAPGAVSVKAPASANDLPAGHYMLFILNGSGVPSVAKIIQLTGTTSAPAAPAAPAAPGSLTAAAAPGPKSILQWADNSTSESAFRIERCQGVDCATYAEIATVAANTTSYTDAGLTVGAAYGYRVRASNSTGLSGYSNSVRITAAGTVFAPIVNRLSGRCMEVPSATYLSTTDLIIRDCQNVGQQLWSWGPVGTTGEIRVSGGKCVDGINASQGEGGGENGNRVTLYDCHGGTNQQWTRTAAGEIRSPWAAMCVELTNKGTANGTKLVLWTCDGSDSQKWGAAGGGAGTNAPPVANFTPSCTGATCTFTNASTDSDGSVVSSSWAFGDGTTSIATSPSHTYATSNTYAITLTVTDDKGATNSVTKSVTVTVTAPPPTNTSPVANFTPSCTGATCTFTNTSTDSDGTVASSSWALGDGATAATANASRTYAASGTYPVTLTVTDNGGATHSVTKSVSVTVPAITLTAIGSKVKGNQVVELKWTSLTAMSVQYYRDEVVIPGSPTTAPGTTGGAYTDNLNRKGGGSYKYKVCQVGGTAVCSAEQTVTF